MNIILKDTNWKSLLPLTYTRPVAELRCGVLTISEKWENAFGKSVSFGTQGYLSKKYPAKIDDENLIINAAILPSQVLINSIQSLKLGEGLTANTWIAVKLNRTESELFLQDQSNSAKEIVWKKTDASISEIKHTWDLFQLNGHQIKADVKLLGLSSNVDQISSQNQVFGHDVYVAEGAKLRGTILNAENGAIVIGKNAEVMEGAIIRGPFALGEGATIKMGAKIYGDTTIGPHCKVGGEVSNVVMFGYSNKGHDGFIGNSVIGEWCNFGADTNSSNLKNNYSPVRVWLYTDKKMVESGLQFCGLIAGDHCKTGINTMLNTGTTLGVSVNVYGGDFPDKFLPSFSWGSAQKMDTFKLDKAFEVAQSMMQRRGLELTKEDKNILQHIFLSDSVYR